MISENESVFPVQCCNNIKKFDMHICEPQIGMTKLEYFTLKIFCAGVENERVRFVAETFKKLRSASILQAKLLIRELEASK